MRNSTLKIMLAAAALSMAYGGAFAQGGGNGQGGTGGGNAHGAATAGMTYHGDPVTSPLAMWPGNTSKMMDSSDPGTHAMSPNDPMNPPKTAQ
ncbi:hypothetical protein GNZ12_03835 [Paraburkholderia sp. 1N]|uniref:Uncharacterized protein n=1 Tax=Paraburkholderia solitsugae TaxID=2675748 RepID=A0ABX2BHM5_9BURK|nr:hypothetical protein [Paraburkholderia solitsugae]NPT40457.1 hypothetical protein [Paraburkholderia solitsugae]